MRTLFLFSIIVLEVACWRNLSPINGDATKPADTDTIMIASYNDPLILDQTKEMLKAKLPLIPGFQFNPQKKYFLKIGAVLPHTLPEGVYEAYLSIGKNPQAGTSAPHEEDLLGLIDLYGLDPATPAPLSWEVTEQLSKQFSNASTAITQLQFCVFFQGNQLPDGSPVAHQGKLELKKISLLEVKE